MVATRGSCPGFLPALKDGDYVLCTTDDKESVKGLIIAKFEEYRIRPEVMPSQVVGIFSYFWWALSSGKLKDIRTFEEIITMADEVKVLGDLDI